MYRIYYVLVRVLVLYVEAIEWQSWKQTLPGVTRLINSRCQKHNFQFPTSPFTFKELDKIVRASNICNFCKFTLRNFKHQIGTESNTQIKMGASINNATFKEELLTNSMDPTVQRKIRPEHKLQTRSIKSLSTKFINEIQLSCELSLLIALKSGKNTL